MRIECAFRCLNTPPQATHVYSLNEANKFTQCLDAKSSADLIYLSYYYYYYYYSIIIIIIIIIINIIFLLLLC